MGEGIIIDGKCVIPEEELKNHWISSTDSQMFNLENLSGTVERSDSIEAELQKFFDDLKKDGKRITRFTGQIVFCDESVLEGNNG